MPRSLRSPQASAPTPRAAPLQQEQPLGERTSARTGSAQPRQIWMDSRHPGSVGSGLAYPTGDPQALAMLAPASDRPLELSKDLRATRMAAATDRDALVLAAASTRVTMAAPCPGTLSQLRSNSLLVGLLVGLPALLLALPLAMQPALLPQLEVAESERSSRPDPGHLARAGKRFCREPPAHAAPTEESAQRHGPEARSAAHTEGAGV
jgi:hypothetical protein